MWYFDDRIGVVRLAPGKPSFGGVAGVELGCRKIERRGRVMD